MNHDDGDNRNKAFLGFMWAILFSTIIWLIILVTGYELWKHFHK